MLKTTIKSCFRGLGFDLVRVHAPAAPPLNQMIDDSRSTNLRERFAAFEAIPGMLPRERGLALYSLAFAQQLRGDVIEIGSWQGRSTCFLAQACRDSGNGVVRAIDHFRGNAHAVNQYKVGEADLSDLGENFRRNVQNAGLSDFVRLYDMPSRDAAANHGDDFNGARLLFIDGDHSYRGALNDFESFEPRLAVGGLIAFDDYHSDGAGVVRTVRHRVLNSPRFGQIIQFPGVLVARKLA